MSTDVMERLTNITLSGQGLLMTINIWLNDFLYVLLLSFLHFLSYFLFLFFLFSLYFFLFSCFRILQDSLYVSVCMLIHTEPRGFNKIALISLSLLSSLFSSCGIYQFATKPGRSPQKIIAETSFNQQIETAFLSLVQPSKVDFQRTDGMEQKKMPVNLTNFGPQTQTSQRSLLQVAKYTLQHLHKILEESINIH